MGLNYYSFDARVIKWQWQALKLVYNLDYSLGVHDIAFCGIVGSAKTTLAAWLALDHCCKFKDAIFFIGRRSHYDLLETSYAEICELVYNTWGERSEKWMRSSTCSINFPWGARIVGGTWGDGRYEKYKSKKFSGAWLEEPTENSAEEYQGFLNIFRPRVGRVSYKNSDVNENFILYSFNAFDPEHPIYTEFYENRSETTHLIESKERDNPFLHERYYDNLLKKLDPLNVRRQVFGEWLTSNTNSIYHAYNEEKHFKNTSYIVNKAYPVHISWDFNIGDGKPLSLVFFQYIKDHFYFFDEIIIEGIRTQESCEEIDSRGYFNHNLKFVLHGDATGRSRDTRSKLSDWLIIKDYFDKHYKKPKYEIKVPNINPPIRKRHNTVNSYMQNGLNENRITLYAKCRTLDKGFKLTAFKKNSSIEDDSKAYQHCTTSAGYGICSCLNTENAIKASMGSRWQF